MLHVDTDIVHYNYVRRLADYLQACPTGPPVDGVKSKKLLPVRTGLVAKYITSPDPGLIAFSITSPGGNVLLCVRRRGLWERGRGLGMGEAPSPVVTLLLPQ